MEVILRLHCFTGLFPVNTYHNNHKKFQSSVKLIVLKVYNAVLCPKYVFGLANSVGILEYFTVLADIVHPRCGSICLNIS